MNRRSKQRRRLLKAAFGSAGAALSGAALSGLTLGRLGGRAAAQSRSGTIATTALRGNLVQITGAGGNVVLLAGDDGIALVDSGAPEAAADLAAHVAGETDGAPVDVLFNTHWHPEHTGANDAFGSAGARIVAHEYTRLWMSTEYYVDWQDRTYAPRAAAALPTDTFYTSDPQPLTAEVGGERIEYGHLREAHTDGDIYVFFREHDVIAAGGAVAVGAYPVLDYATGGWIGGLMDATSKLLELAGADTLIVPETGLAQSRAHLHEQHNMLATVRGRIEDRMRDGQSVEEMLAAGVTDEFDADWGGNRERFVANIYGGLWWYGRLMDSL